MRNNDNPVAQQPIESQGLPINRWPYINLSSKKGKLSSCPLSGGNLRYQESMKYLRVIPQGGLRIDHHFNV